MGTSSSGGSKRLGLRNVPTAPLGHLLRTNPPSSPFFPFFHSPPLQVVEELAKLGVAAEAIEGILQALSLRSVEELEGVVGADSPAVADLRRLFELAAAYGYADWLVFDASVVRGLAYYTGVVFEGFDRAGTLRAICGGGRYDRLLGTFGGEDQPCTGFGFGDAVIVELLKDKNLLPQVRAIFRGA
jgi:histidyl-tRNA synthetase